MNTQWELILRLLLENPTSVSRPLGLYSHSVEVPGGARLVFVSGQVPVHRDGSCADTLAEQADQVYANIVAVLKEKGILSSAIIKLTTFLVEDDPEGVVRQARQKHLGEHRPASTAVWVKRLVDPAWKIEIDAIAMADSSS